MSQLRPSDIFVERSEDGSTYIYHDDTLAHLGRRLRCLTEAKRHIEKEIREVQALQDERLNLVKGLDHLHNFPDQQQKNVLAAFTLALTHESADFLKMSFSLCKTVGAERTNWRTEAGESVEVAFARRLAELEGG